MERRKRKTTQKQLNLLIRTKLPVVEKKQSLYAFGGFKGKMAEWPKARPC